MKCQPASNPETALHAPAAQAPSLPAALPFRIKRIIVPLDFSECSEKALAYAVPFARQFQATLCLVHVEEACYAAPELIAFNLQERASGVQLEAERCLTRIREEKVSREISTEVFVKQGDAAQEITALAKSLEAELIIIATHGWTGLKHVWMGSTAECVVRHAPCPVLIVRQNEREFLATTSA